MKNWLFDEEEDIKQKEWSLGNYTGNKCPNCGRVRVCLCGNGKRRCEKCNWIIEDNSFCPIF